ncbi:MAG TPA: hypothetical protein VGV37_14535 [Aliidongia sp.]|uniref:WapI family immunity protein n=1 Tax=Aliidongia sp. TaxID=1914230 RepID=UPI002DDDAA65|nr:hypothetical protein [Aliidongia sp.]HEV2675759.1 hypothetical protein [Aliidongia sp.]
MTEDLAGALLTDGHCRVFLHPPQFYPNSPGYHHHIDLVGGPFKGTIDASAWQNWMGQFRDDLATLYETLQGEARLPDVYENFWMVLRGDGLGHFRTEIEAVSNDHHAVELKFSFTIDQTQLPAVIAALEQMFMP